MQGVSSMFQYTEYCKYRVNGLKQRIHKNRRKKTPVLVQLEKYDKLDKVQKVTMNSKEYESLCSLLLIQH